MRAKRSRLILIAAAFIAVVIGLFRFMAGSDGDPSDRTEGPADPVETIITANQPTTKLRAPDIRAPRTISPEHFAMPFAENPQNLERIEPRQPLAPPRPTEPQLTRLHQPVPTAAGLVQFREGLLQLADIEVLEAQSVCIDGAGAAWPCGLIARTAFRNYLRGRALSCVVPEGRWTETVITRCRVGEQDPAAWLASRGWVRTVPDSDYAALEDAAREGRKGIYGSDPRGAAQISDSGVDITPLPELTVTPQPDSPQEPGQ